MVDTNPSDRPPDPPRKRKRAPRKLDPTNEADEAFNLVYVTLQFRILHRFLYSKLNPKLSLSWIGSAGRAQIGDPEVQGSSPHWVVLFLPGGIHTMICLGETYSL